MYMYIDTYMYMYITELHYKYVPSETANLLCAGTKSRLDDRGSISSSSDGLREQWNIQVSNVNGDRWIYMYMYIVSWSQ